MIHRKKRRRKLCIQIQKSKYKNTINNLSVIIKEKFILHETNYLCSNKNKNKYFTKEYKIIEITKIILKFHSLNFYAPLQRKYFCCS